MVLRDWFAERRVVPVEAGAPPRGRRLPLAVALVLLMVVVFPAASAAQPAVGLGTAEPFAVLAGSTVTNTGPSVINGNLGVSPGTAITGFPPGIVNGTIHATNEVATQAQADLTVAYNDAAGRQPAALVPGDLGGLTLTPGAYRRDSSLLITGDVILDGQGDPNSVFIFQVGSTLTTASISRVVLTRGAQSCNIFWQIGSSATLGTETTFRGTIMALQSITLNTGATIQGRALARNGAVTLDTNRITVEPCATALGNGTIPGTVPGTAPGTIPGTAPGTDPATQLAITKTAPRQARVGIRIVYTIRVRNAGRNIARNVVMRDPLPRGLVVVRTAPERGVVVSGRMVTARLGNMRTGEVRTVRVVVRSTAGVRGDRINVAVARGTNTPPVRARARTVFIVPALRPLTPGVTG
jgi:uncharacterized repeat protein (TIGR01451 family)